MSTRINTNVTALQAAGNLNSSGNALSQNIQRLSSGLRINGASDDPAGLAISENFKAQISGVTQAVSNSNDAINEIKTAEGALNQVQTLLVTIRQLAVHASNLGVNSTVDTQADQTQINTAIASINRIASTTSFGNKKLLDGSASASTTSARGTVSSAGLQVVAAGSFNAASAGLYDTASVAAATAATDVYSLTGGSLAPGVSGKYSGSVVIGGVNYDIGTGAANLSQVNSIITASGYQATVDSSGELQFASQATGQLGTTPTFDVSNLSVGTDTAVDLTSGAAAAGVGGTVTISGGTAPLDTTLANNTIASSGSLVYTLNGGAAQTLALTAGQALDTVNTALGNAGLTLSATSSALKLSGAGDISVTSFTSKVASTTLNTIGTAIAGGDHNATVTPGGLGALDITAANNTISQAGALVFTDNGGAGNTVSVTAGESWASFQTGVLAQDAGAVSASINGSGQLVLTGGGVGHDIVVTSSTADFGDVGTNENTITAADGSASSYVFPQSGANTLSASGARFAGVITVSGFNATTTILTLTAGTSLASLNSSISATGVTASVNPAGDLLFTGTHALVTPSITLGTDFAAYGALTKSTGVQADGADATLTLSNAISTMTSVSMQKSTDAGYFRFANGMVVSSTVTSGSFTAQINATAGTFSRGQSLQFQLGANEGETATFDIGSTSADQLGVGTNSYLDAQGTTQTVTTSSVDDVNVMTFKGAQDAIAVIDKALDDISTLRANLGSFQSNVLQSNVVSLNVAQQNLSASLSTIEDTDLSTEIVEYTKNQILVQAGTSALGQANQAPQSILKLLQ